MVGWMNVDKFQFFSSRVPILLLFVIYRLGSFTREHAPMKDKHKKDKDKKEKSGKDKSPHGDVLLRTSLSWDSSHGEYLPAAKVLRGSQSH